MTASMLPLVDAIGRCARSPRSTGTAILLLLRFVLINLTGFALLGAAWMQGWIAQILAADDTHICKLIFALFLVGLVWSGQKAWMLSRELNALESGPVGGAAQGRRRSCARSPAATATPARRWPAPCGSSSRTGSPRSATSPARSCCWA